MKSADIAIQIVNYKSKAFLEHLLQAITKDITNSKLSVEINILDNASGDNLEDIGKKWQRNHVHVYATDRNGGFGVGHNILARKTTAKYLLILNPDITFIEEKTVERLLQTLQQHDAAAVGPKLLIPKVSFNEPPQTIPLRRLKQQLWDHGNYAIFSRYHAKNDPLEVDWVSGAVLLAEHAAFKAIGGFDENFFLYYEDVDLCQRLHEGLGRRIIYNPDIQVLHYGSASTKGNGKYKNLIGSFFQYHLKRLKAKN